MKKIYLQIEDAPSVNQDDANTLKFAPPPDWTLN